MANSKTYNLTSWVEEYTEDLYSWAFYKVSDPELAKDLVQDTFLAAAEKISSFKGESSPKTWLYSIMNYKIIDHYREVAKKPTKIQDDTFSKFFTESGEWRNDKKPGKWHDDEKHLLDDEDFHLVLMECLEALPEKWNVCIQSKYLMNKKGEEICQELKITPTNFWQMMHRAKLNLRDCIETGWFGKTEQR